MKKVASIFAMQTADAAYEPLRDRLLSYVNALSRQQRLIADYLLDHLQEVPFLSVPQLAERAGASEATVVRFCRSIGFKGFSDMKMAVVESLREELRSPGSPAGATTRFMSRSTPSPGSSGGVTRGPGISACSTARPSCWPGCRPTRAAAT